MSPGSGIKGPGPIARMARQENAHTGIASWLFQSYRGPGLELTAFWVWEINQDQRNRLRLWGSGHKILGSGSNLSSCFLLFRNFFFRRFHETLLNAFFVSNPLFIYSWREICGVRHCLRFPGKEKIWCRKIFSFVSRSRRFGSTTTTTMMMTTTMASTTTTMMATTPTLTAAAGILQQLSHHFGNDYQTKKKKKERKEERQSNKITKYGNKPSTSVK